MNHINAESVQMLILQQWEMPLHSKERYHFAIETVRQAEILENPDMEFEARYMLCKSSVFTGIYEVMMDSFTRCISQYDRYPGRFSSTAMVWMYKYVLNHVIEFPGIDRQQIISLLADFRERLRAAGGSERTYWFLRDSVAWGLKDAQMLKESLFRWREYPSDEFCNCPACEEDFRIDLFSFLEQYKSAVGVAQFILRQKMICAEVPHLTLAKVLYPLSRLGFYEKAHEAHIKGYRMIYDKPGLADRVFDHIRYLAGVGNLKKAAALFEKHLKDTLDMHGADKTFNISMSSWLLMKRLLSKGKKILSLRLPRQSDLFQPDGIYDVEQLQTHFKEITEDVAARLDARNGNDFYAGEIQRVIGLKRKKSHLRKAGRNQESREDE